ncbi:chlorophyll a/b-binding protein domain-containing protein [Pelagophyceae sp. CCMP2097]|nr:chlorophyll a/b-binding protein domain-containing protein [Pelagophyceae sp. CCMP2097]
MKVALCMLLAPAAALVAPPAAKAMSALQSTEYAQTLYGVGPETGFWDPLKLSDLGTDGTVDFFRAAEVKHGRIAMMATLGYMHHLAGITIPGSLSSSEGITFKSLGAMNPLEAWAAVPAAGVSQIFGAIALVEASEMTHKDGKYAGGDAWFQGFSTNLAFDPLGFGKADAKMVETMKLRELKNGRLAMIGIMGFVASSAVPGSVPMLH